MGQLDTATALDMIDWYRRCLEDVQDGRVVRGLDEAKVGYDRAMEFLRRGTTRPRNDHHHEYVGGNCIHCTLPSLEKVNGD